MRTSLNKIKAIDDYLSGQMNPGDALVFKVNMILNDDLSDEIKHQQNTYAMIKQYGRQKIKEEIIAVQTILATAPKYRSFMKRITNLF
jgi:hypothetical protein